MIRSDSLYEALRDFTLGREDDPIGKAVENHKNPLTEETLNLADKYDIVPTPQGFYIFVDRTSKDVEIHNEELFKNTEKRLNSNFDAERSLWIKGTGNEKELMEGLLKLETERRRIRSIKKSEERKLVEVAEEFGSPFLYVFPDRTGRDMAYHGDKEEAIERIEEIQSLMGGLKTGCPPERTLSAINSMYKSLESRILEGSDKDAVKTVKKLEMERYRLNRDILRRTTPYRLSENLELTKRLVQNGQIPDFNPTYLESVLFNHVDSVDYSADSKNSGMSTAAKIIGGGLVILAAATLAYGLYNSNNHGSEEPNNQTEPIIPPSNQTEPIIPPPNNQTEPIIPPSNQTEPIIPPPNNQTEPIIPPSNQTEPIIPPPNNQTEPQLEGLEGQLYNQSSLFREVYSNQEIVDNILSVAAINGSDLPRNLAYQILNQIQNDNRVTDKVGLAREAFKLYVDYAGQIQNIKEIWNVNNATYHFGTANALKSEIDSSTLSTVLGLLRQNAVDVNFDSARKHASLLRLAEYVPPIMNHTGDWKEGCEQVDEIVYKHGFDKVNGEVYVWTQFIKPSVAFILGQREKGVITAPDGEIDLLHANLLQIDIKTGEYTEIGREPDSMCLGVGVKNVNPDGTGESPLEWLYDLAHNHYTNRTKTIDWLQQKWSPFDIAMYSAYKRGEGLGLNWPNCSPRYKADLDSIRASSGDLIPFLIGEPYLLRGFYPNQIVPNMSEQMIPYYTTLVAYPFGLKTRVNGAIYPNGIHWHDEPAFRLNEKWFSFYGFNDYTEFKKDYEGMPAAPDLTITDTSGKPVKVIL